MAFQACHWIQRPSHGCRILARYIGGCFLEILSTVSQLQVVKIRIDELLMLPWRKNFHFVSSCVVNLLVGISTFMVSFLENLSCCLDFLTSSLFDSSHSRQEVQSEN